MAKFNRKDEHRSSGNSANAAILTAAQFFGKEGNQGYDTPQNFLKWGEKLTDSDENHLRNFIQHMKDGRRTDGGSEIRRDVAGLQYRFYRVYLPKSQPGAKVVLGQAILRLIDDYQHGRIHVGFTLDELIEEANKG